MNVKYCVFVFTQALQMMWLCFNICSSNNMDINTMYRKIHTESTYPFVCRTELSNTLARSKVACLKGCGKNCMAVTFQPSSGACALCNLHGLVSSTVVEDLQVYEKVYNGKNYIVSNSQYSWTDAKDYCNQYYDGLAIVLNAEEDAQLRQAVLNSTHSTPGHWIGGSKVNDAWYWVTSAGGLVDFIWMNWVPGQPSNGYWEDCVWIWNDFAWDDNKCYERNYFVCQLYK